MEGKAWWLLKAAPVPGRELLRGKFAAALIPFAILSTLLLVGAAIWQGFSLLGAALRLVRRGTARRGDAGDRGRGGGAVGDASTGMIRARWARAGAALISFLVGTAFAGLAGGLLCLPLIVAAFWPDATVIAWIVGPLGALAATAGIIWLSLWLGGRLLWRVGEA